MRQPSKRLLQPALFVLILLLTACGATGIPTTAPLPTATATALLLPPTIVETVPQAGSELGPKATLLVFFSNPMDKASVEAALTSDFADGHLLNWVDEITLAITPKTAYPENGQIAFTVAATAKDTNGLTLPNPQTFSYRTASPLRVAQTLPISQAVDVSPDSAVVVSFNQPVVALGAENAPAGLTLEPAAQGQGEWINTSTYIFRPQPGLAGGVDYTVRVNPQLSATSGVTLDASAQNTTWSFRTSLPRLLEVTPAEADGPLLLDPEIKLTFNQPMNRASVEAGLAFSGPREKLLTGSFIWNDKSTVLTFKPSTLLERSSTYTLTLSGQARSHGGATLGSDSTFSYESVAPFAILTTPFTSGTTRPREKTIRIIFTAPIDQYKTSELDTLITINPKPEYSNYFLEGQRINVNSAYLPGQSYIITFSRDLKDRWGQPLGENLTFSFREPNAEPSVSFGGYYSPMLFTTTSAPRLGVQAVNINQLDIVLGEFTLPNYFRYGSDYTYQQNYTPNQIDAWSELLDLAPNQNKPYTVDLLRDGKRQPLPPGLYYVDISSKEIARARQAISPVLISNVNLTLKTNSTQAFAWAVDLRTQTPAANQPITLYNAKGDALASGTTDANGLWQTTYKPSENRYDNLYAVLGQPSEDLFGMASDGWNAEIAPWNFGISASPGVAEEDYYFYTERPVYRPGDVVHYRGMVRNKFDGRYTEAAAGNLIVTMNLPTGQAAPQTVPISGYGTFNGEITLSANAIPGYYSLSVNRSDKPEDSQQNFAASISFQVADYRKPEINLTAELAPTIATNGQAITGAVNAAYFFGAPVSDLAFEWRLYKNRSSFDLPTYTTGLYRTDWYTDNRSMFGESIASGQGRTGTDGHFSIALDQINVDDTAELTLEVTASESGGFLVSARATTTLHPASFYIGVRPAAWFGSAGSPLRFDALTVDLDKNPIPSKSLTASFQKVTWERNDLSYGYSFTPTYTPIESQKITSSDAGKTSVTFTPAEAGTYMLEMSSSEGAKTQTLLWVSGAQNAAWPNLPYQRMELTADKDNYKPGENASIFIPNQFAVPALALITTERSSIHSSQVVTVPPEGYTFTLPITDEQAPNTYVSVTMLGPDADFRQGYVNLPVEPSAFTLHVDLKASPAKAKPGDKLTIDLTVTDAKGQPMQAEFSMAVVDLAALALAEPNAREIVPAYYGNQPLGIRTGLTDAVYARRVFPVVGGQGGGGGSEGLTLREKFPDTAYWKADVVTDAQGKAQITLTLPDNLTTWQIDTRGLTKDTKVGQATVQMVTSKELLIRPQTPRFLVVGDHTELAAIVNNNTATELETTVSLQATGFSLDDPATVQQKVTVPANGRIRVVWPGTVKTDSQIKSIFTVKAGSLQDSARPADGDIPVLHYSAPQTFSTAGVLADAASRLEILAMPKSFKALDGKLDVELSPSLASVIVSELQAEKTAPEDINWNNERLASHLLSQLSTYQTLKDAGLSSNPLNDSVIDAVRHLVANQSYDNNAWSWVAGSNQPADPYLTAYILFALHQASKANLGIDLSENLKRGAEYLVTAPPLDAQSDLSQPWALNRAVFYSYVLQQISGSELDRSETLDALYTSRDKLDPWAKALLAETLISISATDERAKTLLSDLQSNPIRSATGVHWQSVAGDGQNPNSPLFTSAAIVYVLAQRDPANPILADAARYLAAQRGAGRGWGSSYEKTWVILALNQYMKGTGELKGSFNYAAALNGVSLAQGDTTGVQKLESVTISTPLSQMYTESANSLLISREAGTGKLYYRAALTLDRPVESVQPISQGLTVSRQYFTCNAADCQPITSFQMPTPGAEQPQPSRVKVQVSITLPNDAYYLMVQDHIPAGAEILDSSLKTSQQGEQSQSITPQYDNADPFAGGWGWWYFNPTQIYSDHILWNADYLPAGTYVLTYTIVPSLPGQYRVLPAHAWHAYFPETQGTSAGNIFEIKPAK